MRKSPLWFSRGPSSGVSEAAPSLCLPGGQGEGTLELRALPVALLQEEPVELGLRDQPEVLEAVEGGRPADPKAASEEDDVVELHLLGPGLGPALGPKELPGLAFVEELHGLATSPALAQLPDELPCSSRR